MSMGTSLYLHKQLSFYFFLLHHGIFKKKSEYKKENSNQNFHGEKVSYIDTHSFTFRQDIVHMTLFYE